jgi:8-oxo-dGTP pyrophosphatase MutT (NUDIX family)
MITRDSAVALVAAFSASNDEMALKSQELILMLLRHSEDPFTRDQFAPGHITATSVVLSPDQQFVLLVHHRRLERWLLPGGHVEPGDESLEASARREIEEETGAMLSTVPGMLVGMDVHGIPPKKKEPYHQHHDLIFTFRAVDMTVRTSEESREVRWCEVSNEEFRRYALPEPIVRAIGRSRS